MGIGVGPGGLSVGIVVGPGGLSVGIGVRPVSGNRGRACQWE